MKTYPRIKRLKSRTRVEKRHRHGLPYIGPFYFHTRGCCFFNSPNETVVSGRGRERGERIWHHARPRRRSASADSFGERLFAWLIDDLG